IDPKWARGFLWRANEKPTNPSAESTVFAEPFPCVPIRELNNTTHMHTISSNPHLFKIVTPINVDHFEELLAEHPNRPLVDSACKGLREGFWPFAETDEYHSDLPIENENHPLTAEKLAFLREQRDTEINADRFSLPFSTLLPGMHVSALGAVPKPHSEKLRLITDQSRGPLALNSWISSESASVRYDTLRDLAIVLREYRKAEPHQVFTLWKSDVASAFRLIPMHPLWQIRQVIKIDETYHVDRCMVFGNRAAPRIWCTIAGLLAWIGIYKRKIRILQHYMDDYWSIERNDLLIPYRSYGDLRPHTQVQFLSLLDYCGFPHEQRKQIYGTSLLIIGFIVDTNAMTITMPPESKTDLIAAIEAFRLAPSRMHPLRDWQRLLGWMNWALNVYPLARPALQSSYEKIAGKSHQHAMIYLNAAVKQDLTWFADYIASSSGINLITADLWDIGDAEDIFYCDASLSGLGFWSPNRLIGAYCILPSLPTTSHSIFYNETLSVVSALQFIADHMLPASGRPRPTLIYTDSMNTVEIFSALNPLSYMRPLVMRAISLADQSNISLRVLHIQGIQNTIADALSR
ncbi:DNA/RNA polymerase, partial [Sistotremastrum suecicum HHB10207 ss-3]